MKVIFLDIDGVLNCEQGYIDRSCEYIDGPGFKYQKFYPPSKELLNKLIEESGAKIVISSSWRKDGLQRMQEIWKAEEMSGEVIDTTPSIYLQKNGSIQFWNGQESKHPTPKTRGYSIPRGCEIQYWLKDLGFYHINWSEEEQDKYVIRSGIENYVIIDDDSDMLYGQRNNFVHVHPSPRNKEGFGLYHYNLAKEILSKTITQITYGK
jgi:hypothetical protein